MIVTTTTSLEGKRVVKYLGVVTGESIVGANIIRDIQARFRDIFALTDDVRAAYGTLAKEVDAALGRSDRCRIDEIEDEGYKRYLVHNFRRTSSSAHKRVLL